MARNTSGMSGFGALGEFALGEADWIGGGDNPPTSLGGPVALKAEAYGLAQPNPWTYNFCGGRQPFEQRKLCPGIPGQSIDRPPVAHPERSVGATEIKALWQPDPWTYSFAGGLQPFAPRRLPPALTAVPVNDPPFTLGGPIAIGAEIVATAQPSPWTYTFNGGWQPYQPGRLTPPQEGPVPPPATLPPAGGGKRKRPPVRPIWDRAPTVEPAPATELPPAEATAPVAILETHAPDLAPAAASDWDRLRAQIAPAEAPPQPAAPAPRKRPPVRLAADLAEHPDVASGTLRTRDAQLAGVLVEDADELTAFAKALRPLAATALLHEDPDQARGRIETDDDDEVLRLLLDGDDDEEALDLLE